jgi:hypothetical protein
MVDFICTIDCDIDSWELVDVAEIETAFDDEFF